MATFSWKFSGLDTNGKAWTGFEYWLLYVDGGPHSAIPVAAVTPAYVPGVSTTYTCDLTKIDPVAVSGPAPISIGTHTFAAAAVGGGVAGAAGPTTSVAYAPPTAVPPVVVQPPIPSAPVAASAVP
jgi:hypothetical protein